MRISILMLSIALPFAASAWGPTGHRVVGEIADRHLTDKAREKVYEVLGGDSPAMSANWMDFIKSEPAYDPMKPWHYSTIPDSLTYDEAGTPEEGDALQTIERILKEIETGNFADWTEAEALKTLIHLVGDVHQPLHVGNGHDRGGNDVKVKWFGRNSNLHRVWDSEIIDDQQLSYTEYANWIDTATKDQIAQWQCAKPIDWLNESKEMRASVYAIDNPERLGYRYIYDHIDEVNQRLLQAGIRLAGLLNALYG